MVASRTHRTTKVDLPEEYKIAEILFKVQGSNKKQLSSFGAIVIKK